MQLRFHRLYLLSVSITDMKGVTASNNHKTIGEKLSG